MCYRCPLRAKVLNPTGLSKHTARHFLRMHGTPNREYIVTLYEEPLKQIRIRTGGNMERRSGADPPTKQQIQDLEEQTEQKPQKEAGIKGKVHQKIKYKQKGKIIKKKKRPGGLQMEGEGWSHVNPKRGLKRQRTGKSERTPDKLQDHETVTNETESQRSDQKEDDDVMEHPQNLHREEEAEKGQQQRKVQEGQQNPREGLARLSPNQQLESSTTKMGSLMDAKQNQQGTSGKKREQEKEMPKPEQQNQPRKRQRTIFDYAGMRAKDGQGTVHQQKEKPTPGEVMECNPTDSDQMQNKARTEQQMGPMALSSNAEENPQSQHGGTPDKEKANNQ